MVDMSGSTATAVHYYLPNRIGSIVGMVDGAAGANFGVLTDQYLYSPFGVEEPLAGSGNPYRYTGRYYDAETGLYYYRSRYYDPGVGRFDSPDPILYDDQWNTYAYVGNNPINNIDPTGENAKILKFGYKVVKKRGNVVAAAKEIADEIRASIEIIQSTDDSVTFNDKIDAAFELITGIPAPSGATITTNDSKEKSESGPKLKDLKKISKGRIKELKKGGFDAEDVKEGEKMGGKEDLFIDKDGNIFVGAKGGFGEATPTGENIKDFLE